jgi:TPP-dependent indolepyruvate ferredoxin oxidoreductase alpha subunit
MPQYQGLKVIVARRECAIQSNRRKVKYAKMSVDADKCVNCKICINVTVAGSRPRGKTYRHRSECL